MASRLSDDIVFSGKVTLTQTPAMPADSIARNDQIAAGVNIAAAKVCQRYQVRKDWVAGSDVTAGTYPVYVAHAAGTVVDGYVIVDAAPAGGMLSMIVDVKKSTGGAAWASILSGTTTISSSATARTAVALSLGSTASCALVAGDLLEIVVTTSGTGGTNVQGAAVIVVIEENGV